MARKTKLLPSQVEKLKTLYETSGLPNSALGLRFGLTSKAIWSMAHREGWKRLTPSSRWNSLISS